MSELFSVRNGRGRPILVIHGGLGLDHGYMRALDRLTDVAEFIYVDVRANGRSPRAGVEAMTLESIAGELDALRAELGFERWTVLGHSFGSFVALTYAIRYPDRVAGLVVVASAPSFEHAPAIAKHIDDRNQPAAAAALLAALGTAPASDAEFGEVWRQILPLYFHAWNARYLAAFAETAYSAPGYVRGNELLATYNVRAALDKISAPTLVIAGDDDFVTPADLCSAVLAKSIPQAQLSVIRDSGHFPHLETPVAFDAEVRAWLTAASRT
jgi:proline iminopeptidase